jgi:hypothetical protein
MPFLFQSAPVPPSLSLCGGACAFSPSARQIPGSSITQNNNTDTYTQTAVRAAPRDRATDSTHELTLMAAADKNDARRLVCVYAYMRVRINQYRARLRSPAARVETLSRV